MGTAPIAESPSAVLRRVGIVFIAVGVLDIAWLFYLTASEPGYSFGFNIFAVIVGIRMYRQNLRTARFVAILSACFLAAFAVMLIALPLVFPNALIRTYIRVTPIASLVGSGAFLTVALAILWWGHQELASPPVQAAIRFAGLDDRRFLHRPRSGFWLGGALAIVLAAAWFFVGRSETAQEAVERARAAKGPGFHYFVSSLSISWTGQMKTDVQATVLAYTDSTIETVVLKWQK